MKKSVSADRFFDFLMRTIRFKETVDLYFEGAYRKKYDEIFADSQSPIRCFKESPDFSISTFLPLVKSGMSTKGMSII